VSYLWIRTILSLIYELSTPILTSTTFLAYR